MKLTINLVTRGRPDRLIETVRKTVSNMVLADTEFHISIDDDDRQTIDALQFLPDDARILPDIRPREDSLGEKYNRAILWPADVYMPMSDYGPHMTLGFDEKVLEAAALFPDGIGVVYNSMENFSFPGINAVTHGLVEKMGFLYPPYFPYWFVDHWLDDIAKLIDRIAYAEVHLGVQRKPPTQEMRDCAFWATFFDACRLLRRNCAAEIIRSDDFIEPDWRKKLLLSHYPIIEYKSQWINDHVRKEAQKMDARSDVGNGGERYERLKAKAIKMLTEQAPEIFADMAEAERKAA